MDYWKDKPAKLLLDERLTGMTPEELMAWFWLKQRARTQTPPGVLPADEKLLQRWSGLKPKQWESAKVKVMSNYQQDSEGRFHDPEIKLEYHTFCTFSHEKSVEGKRKANARWKNKEPLPKFSDPYAGYVMQKHAPAMQQHSSGIGKNGDSEKEMPLYAGACTSIGDACTGNANRSIHQIDLKGDEPPTPAAAVTPDPENTPPPRPSLAAMLRQPPPPPMSAEQIAARKLLLDQQFQAIDRQTTPPSPPIVAPAAAE